MTQSNAVAKHMMLHMQQQDHRVIARMRPGEFDPVDRLHQRPLLDIAEILTHTLARLAKRDASDLKVHLQMLVITTVYHVTDMFHTATIISVILQQLFHGIAFRRIDKEIHVAVATFLGVGIIHCRRSTL